MRNSVRSRVRWTATLGVVAALVLGGALPAYGTVTPAPDASPSASSTESPAPDGSAPSPAPSQATPPAPDPQPAPEPEPAPEPAPVPAPEPAPEPQPAPAPLEEDQPITPFLIGDPTASLSIQKVAGTDVLGPGDIFTYTVQFQCTAGTVAGCANTVVTDPMPQYLTIVGTPTITGSTSFSTAGTTPTLLQLAFTEPLGGGLTGLNSGKVVTVEMVVQVADPLPASADGQTLTNTATIESDNAATKTSSAGVELEVPAEVAASATKTIIPGGGPNTTTDTTEASVTGTNASNVPVRELVISDPVLADNGAPPTTGNPFQYLGITQVTGFSPPAGADEFQVRFFNSTTGTWVNGPVVPLPGVPSFPPGVDPDEVTGFQLIFRDTSGDGIAPGATARLDVDLALRAPIPDDELPLVITNDTRTTVTTTDGTEATSDPASATYRVPASTLDIAADKTFAPSVVHAGDETTATLTGINTSGAALDTMTITEPATGAVNHFEDGTWTFTGLGAVTWPAGTTGATITYVCNGTPGSPQTAVAPNTLPAPLPGCAPVTGFSVVFDGPIADGATATIPVELATNPDQPVEEMDRTNTVGVSGEVSGSRGDATHTAVITTIADRIQVEAGKRAIPTTIPSVPGQQITLDLSARLLPFPQSTVGAQQIIVQDPQDFATDQWYDSFDPRVVTATPIPSCSSMTVQYTTDDGGTWLDIPGMVEIVGATIFNAPIPEDIATSATGIRFIYDAAPAGGPCSGEFPPGTFLSPNVSFALQADAGFVDVDTVITDCAGAQASSDLTGDAVADPACADITLTPVDPGSLDPIDKAWDVDLLNARSQAQAGATLSWSTAGYTGVGRMEITDTADAATTPLAYSVFDEFDLVRIDPITPTQDPHLTYDQVAAVQLYRLPAGSTDVTAGSWSDAPNDPCPAACDGTFPGYTLSAADRAVTVAFRLVFIESPTRADRATTPGAPPVGTGVAASSANDRHIHPVFQLRDELRSDSDVPITASRLYNVVGEPGAIFNSVRLAAFVGIDDDTPAVTLTDGDTIFLDDVAVTVDATKSWTGGPLGIPAAGVPQDRYPLSRVTVTATNTTPAKIDSLVVTEPWQLSTGPGSCTTNPFDSFDLVDFTTITIPAGTTATVVRLSRSGITTDYTQAQALALTAAQLADVTGFVVQHTGRINAGVTTTIGFDVQLRTQNRVSLSPPLQGQTVCNQAHAEAADLVGYPAVEPVTATDDPQASIALVAQGVVVTAGKTLSPTFLVEPATGPVAVTLSGQPSGPSRAVSLLLEDSSPTFFNQYDFTGFLPITWVSPVDTVRADVLTGGTWSVQGGVPVLTGGTWVAGAAISAPATTPALPVGVTPDDVQGVRFTFTKADGTNWENPATPNQTARFGVERRDTLNTGGPVPSDLAGSTPAPGETVAGNATNTITATATSSDVDIDGNPLTAVDDATAIIQYRHANNAVQIRKGPNGSILAPGTPFRYTITVTDTGSVDIVDPVVTDIFPADASGPQIALEPDPAYQFVYSGNDGAMPTDLAEITITATATGLTFAFPAGSMLPVGESYTISFLVQTRAGLAAGTQFTNTTGVTGERPWDQCDGGTGAGSGLDPATGECRTTAVNAVQSAGALRVSKTVQGEGSEVLGTDVDPLWLGIQPVCLPDSAGFYAAPCIPIAQPGGDVTWRLTFTNSGNRPLDRVLGIDRLPAPGDAVATAPSLPRFSEWRPLLSGVRPVIAAGAGTYNVFFTTATSGWCDGPQAVNGQLLCPAMNWQPWPDGAALPVDPASVTGLQFEYLPTTPIAPAASFTIDVPMAAPPFSPADTPNQVGPSLRDTYAFNTIGSAARWNTGAQQGYTLTTEPPRVGVGLAHGAVELLKTVSGDAADQYAPQTFSVTLSCVSDGVPVPIAPDVANLTLRPGIAVTVYDLPYLAECELLEGDNGQTTANGSSAVVQVGGIAELETATLDNVYEYASLSVSKLVESSAVDQDGSPIPYGPFAVAVDCTFLGAPVYADGYGPDDPMQAVLEDGDEITFTGLPAGADCVVTETDDKGAASVTVTTVSGGGEPVTTEGTEAGIALAPDGDGTANTAEIVNAFDVGSVQVVKEVTGEVADLYGAGPFTLRLVCTLDDASGERTVHDAEIVLGGNGVPPFTETIENIAAGAECTLTEPDDAGASTVTITPDGPFPVDGGTTATVTAVNTFDPAIVLVDKQLDGEAFEFAPETFPIEVTCWADGELLPGFPITVDVTPGTPAEIDTLAGAECSAIELDSGSATDVTYDPPRDDDGDGSGLVTAVGDTQEPATITIVNTYRAGALQILKTIEGSGAAAANGPFVFSVVCSFNGDETAFEQTVTLRRTSTSTSTALASEVIAPLPVGAECTVTETDDGGADRTPPPVIVTIPDASEDGPVSVTYAEFTNTFTAPLPPTGGTAPAWWIVALALSALGGGILILVFVRARRRSLSS